MPTGAPAFAAQSDPLLNQHFSRRWCEPDDLPLVGAGRRDLRLVPRQESEQAELTRRVFSRKEVPR